MSILAFNLDILYIQQWSVTFTCIGRKRQIMLELLLLKVFNNDKTPTNFDRTVYTLHNEHRQKFTQHVWYNPQLVAKYMYITITSDY